MKKTKDNIFILMAIFVAFLTVSGKAAGYRGLSITDCFTSLVVRNCAGSSSVLSDALAAASANSIIASKPFVAAVSGSINTNECPGIDIFCCATIISTTDLCAPLVTLEGITGRFVISEIYYKD